MAGLVTVSSYIQQTALRSRKPETETEAILDRMKDSVEELPGASCWGSRNRAPSMAHSYALEYLCHTVTQSLQRRPLNQASADQPKGITWCKGHKVPDTV